MSIIKTTYTDTEGNKYYKATFVLLSRKRIKDSCGDWFGKCDHKKCLSIFLGNSFFIKS